MLIERKENLQRFTGKLKNLSVGLMDDLDEYQLMLTHEQIEDIEEAIVLLRGASRSIRAMLAREEEVS